MDFIKTIIDKTYNIFLFFFSKRNFLSTIIVLTKAIGHNFNKREN